MTTASALAPCASRFARQCSLGPDPALRGWDMGLANFPINGSLNLASGSSGSGPPSGRMGAFKPLLVAGPLLLPPWPSCCLPGGRWLLPGRPASLACWFSRTPTRNATET